MCVALSLWFVEGVYVCSPILMADSLTADFVEGVYVCSAILRVWIRIFGVDCKGMGGRLTLGGVTSVVLVSCLVIVYCIVVLPVIEIFFTHPELHNLTSLHYRFLLEELGDL